jgi:hypothetical protein
VILLTDLLTTDLDGHGRGWGRSPATCPASSSNRHSWTALDVPDLATDQKVAGSSPRDMREMSEAPVIKAVTSAEVRRSAQEPARAAYPVC